MDTFNSIAGVQETSNDATTQPPHPTTSVGEPDLEAQNDHDHSHNQSLSQRPSRASLPINRQPSNKSLRSHRSDRHLPADYPPSPAVPIGAPQATRSHAEDSASFQTSGSEEFAWGPSHPCFPHPNPHCLPSSDEYQRSRVIRVRRDWLQAGDLYPQYANLYPEILDTYVSDDDFRSLISTLNALLKDAFDPFTNRAWVDSMLGVASGFLWDDLGLTGAKKGNKKVEQYLDTWNVERERAGVDIRVVQLKRTGFMALDFVIPDPGIDEEQDDGQGMDGSEEGAIGPAE